MCVIGGVALGRTIDEVEVKGNQAIGNDAIARLLTSRPGAEFDAALVRADLLSLHGSGFFTDVDASLVEEAGTQKLVFSVVEKPSIAEIEFIGLDAISTSSLEEKLSSKRFQILDEGKLTADLRVLEEAYGDKGYYLARARYEAVSVGPNQVKVRFSVQERLPLSVRNVRIIGNTDLGEEALKGKLATRELRWTPFWGNSGTFKDELVQRDKEALGFFFRDDGYAEATIGPPQVRLDPSRENVDVSFSVEEGERFTVGTLSSTGDLLWPAERLREKLTLQSGKVFRISQFYQDLKVLSDLSTATQGTLLPT